MNFKPENAQPLIQTYLTQANERLEKARIEADYTHLRKFTREEVTSIIQQAQNFVEMAQRLTR